MTSYSKYFKIVTENTNCGDYVHCGSTCMELLRSNALNVVYGCFKYIGPISMVNVVIILPLKYGTNIFFFICIDTDSNENWPIECRSCETMWQKISRIFNRCLADERYWYIMYVPLLVSPKIARNEWVQPKIYFQLFWSKLLGKFYTWSILAFPAASGAILCAVICSNRLILMFSRGLSTMVRIKLPKCFFNNPFWYQLNTLLGNGSFRQIICRPKLDSPFTGRIEISKNFRLYGC